jgi:arginase family enzyme
MTGGGQKLGKRGPHGVGGSKIDPAAPAPLPKRPLPLSLGARERARVVFWGYSLFGNPGAESGVEELFQALTERAKDYRAEPRCRQHAVAKSTKVQMWDYNTVEDYASWRRDMRRYFFKCLEADEFPLFVTGNHLGMLPVYEALASIDARICVVSLDAHLDIYDWAAEKEPLNHGNFLRKLARGSLAVVNVGHRDLTLAEDDVRRFFDRAYGIDALLERGLPDVVGEVADFARNFDATFLDLDVDVLDQSTMAATGCPVPFGLTSKDLLSIIVGLWDERLLGVGVSEYNGLLDRDGSGRDLLGWLIEFILARRPNRPAAREVRAAK